jgi:hypothetical protein
MGDGGGGDGVHPPVQPGRQNLKELVRPAGEGLADLVDIQPLPGRAHAPVVGRFLRRRRPVLLRRRDQRDAGQRCVSNGRTPPPTLRSGTRRSPTTGRDLEGQLVQLVYSTVPLGRWVARARVSGAVTAGPDPHRFEDVTAQLFLQLVRVDLARWTIHPKVRTAFSQLRDRRTSPAGTPTRDLTALWPMGAAINEPDLARARSWPEVKS